ncbi:MAG: CRISPR system Cascade subunit CasC [bacterium]|jgi:CRISPR system Cascade subunit CasC
MSFLQIHTLTSHSANNLNRDDLGQPKTVTYLGNSHGRISSQCLKKSIRETFKNYEELEGKTAIRTRHLPREVRTHLTENEVSEKLISLMAIEIASLGLKKDSKAKEELTQLIFLTNAEIEEVKNLALKLCKECEGEKLSDVKKEFKKAIAELFKAKKFQDGVDVAMFGRMTTSDVFENCEASVQVAHAITTYPVKNQYDFFTAVDDLAGKEETGSGHMDDLQFNTGIFYKYATVDLNLLKENLNQDKTLTQKAVIAFLKSFVSSLPTGKQNSMAAHQHPFTIFVTLGTGSNSNLTNAFANLPNPNKNGNAHPFATTTQELIKEFNSEQNFFGDLKQVDHALVATQKEEFLKTDDLGSVQKIQNLSILWEQLETKLEEVI